MTSDAERAELIALKELREAVATVAANRGGYWTRPGSRESAQQIGEQDAFRRVLVMIDGRMSRDRKPGRKPEGTAADGPSERDRLGVAGAAEALVPPAEVVPAAGA